mmetsp:Transcript_20404/g.33786  ORF Transcript_20404/g.33786 Transcript_20404/m.33786 type:complete len:175 (+) Transcript_20404:109-633(+)
MSSVGVLPDSLQRSLQSLVDRVNACGGGIQVVLLSTSEGVSLGRVTATTATTTNGSGILLWNEEVLANLESTWAPPSKQFPLLQQGDVLTVTAQYEQLTLVHVYSLTPVVATLLLETDHCNMGAVKSTAIPLLKEILEPLCQTLLSSLSGPPPDTAAAAVAAPSATGGESAYYQ